ncbi:MAG: molybdenum cofactor guanylyltransferase [Deferribacteraceae bacterium]|jgi:molybdopterin-guanine dinucleotide biosynthesis protein A|nr:molybdenum cofactor guanylyltransferase [Deferribacteraceae bacterium]
MNALSCAILAGGASRRFGEDKTLAVLGSKPLIQSVYEGVSDYSDDVMVVSKEPAKYDFLKKARQLQDISEKQCAMTGVITALTYAKYDKAFVISADTPLFPFGAIPMMNAAGEVVIPLVGGKLATLSAVYSKNILPLLNASFEKNEYKLSAVLEKTAFTKLGYSVFLPYDRYFESETINGFININTQEDIKTAWRLLGNNPK